MRAIQTAALMFVFAFGCDAADEPKRAADAAPAATVARPGYFSGRVIRPDGKPIGIEKVKFKITIAGIAGQGDRVAYHPEPDGQGQFSVKLAEGIYKQPYGTVTIPFDNGPYTYTLYPRTEITSAESARGIACDFEWRITGPTKQDETKPDPANHTHWYGGTSVITWEQNYVVDGKTRAHEVPAGTSFLFTATPKGKWIDGSDGKRLTWKREWHPTFGVRPGTLNDIPPAAGGYTVTATEITPEGKERPLILNQLGKGDSYVRQLDMVIEPNQSYGTPFAPTLRVTRPIPQP